MQCEGQPEEQDSIAGLDEAREHVHLSASHLLGKLRNNDTADDEGSDGEELVEDIDMWVHAMG
jgi:hypothetical protein